ncbi:MAG TPA: di-heme-cytochrome C peroxidase [Tardiphaga sp.]
MHDDRIGTAASEVSAPGPAVSPDNPCPFLRAVVAAGVVDGHVVPLSRLCSTVEAATGATGLKKWLAGVKTYPVALIANGLGPLRLLRSMWSGARLDELRDGPLDKHGSGSRILDANAHVSEAELERLAEFGKDRPDPAGGVERGLTAEEITAYMDANFARAKGSRRLIDRLLMKGEWPVLLDIMGKGEGAGRYLSVAEVRTLFVDTRLPARIAARLSALPARQGAGVVRKLVTAAVVLVALAGALIVAVAAFPDQVRAILPAKLAQLLPPPLPDRVPIKAAFWLDQNWTTEDRHWFHHASQGTATFPVPYNWFIALEQPVLHLLARPGLVADSGYLERFGFMPSPKSVRVDEATLRRFGYPASSDAKPAPETVAGLKPLPADNLDGLPVGFARMVGGTNPTTGFRDPDRIGLTCAACHAGSIRYNGVSVRFDGGPAMVDLRKLELVTGLSIAYTLNIPGRFKRFADRVLGPDAGKEERNKLEKDLKSIGDDLLGQVKLTEKTLKEKNQENTEEGNGRLDALNRIGNQVFFTNLIQNGLQGYEKNIHANDAPVSFPPVWTVPWLLWAQYDGSIEQPLIRNAGEAMGVTALVNFSPNAPRDDLFRSSVALENLVRIEAMLRGSDPFAQSPKGFNGLAAPKWPAQLFPDDPAWKIDPAKVARGRALYAEICAECHLGPVNDSAFDAQFPDKSLWSPDHWLTVGTAPQPVTRVLKPVMKPGMGTDGAQADVLLTRQVKVPGFLDMQPARDLGARWGCAGVTSTSTTEMPFAIALMIAVNKLSDKWIEDHKVVEPQLSELWGPLKNCPNPVSKPHYRARPLNGVWATAPYLHNGSVPSLYWLLKPAAERPTEFCIGDRDFDPQQVGFRVAAGDTASCRKGETRFATKTSDGKEIHGNSVLGHSLEGTPGPGKTGIIGRALNEDERYDLIEYLKTL